MTIAAGTVLAGRYRVIRPIGSGGMGEVYEAEQTSLGRRVAVKVLFDDDERALARFEQEARAMGKLSHRHVVNIIDFHFDGGRPILVMELLEGESLLTLLLREKRVEPARAVRIAMEMLDALGAAHDGGIIHRDIKPSNVFLVRKPYEGEEGVRLVDFGIAKLLEGSARKTTTGEIVGTPSYLSPEQLFGEPIDGRADVRAVGLCLFEMLTGRRPWRTPRGPELAAEIIRDEPLTLEDVGVSAPAALSAIVARAIARQRDARFADARAMQRALSQLGAAQLGRITVPLVPVTPRAEAPAHKPTIIIARAAKASPVPKRSTRMPLMASVVALMLLGIAALAFARRNPPRAPLAAPVESPSSRSSPVASTPPLWSDPHHPEDSNDTNDTPMLVESVTNETHPPPAKTTKAEGPPVAQSSNAPPAARFDQTCKRVDDNWVCTSNRPPVTPRASSSVKLDPWGKPEKNYDPGAHF